MANATSSSVPSVGGASPSGAQGAVGAGDGLSVAAPVARPQSMQSEMEVQSELAAEWTARQAEWDARGREASAAEARAEIAAITLAAEARAED